MAAIPKILHGTIWTFPSATSTDKMRAASVNCTGRWDTMRCPEVIVAILNNPVRADPVAAICYRGLCDARRLMSISDERYENFRNCLISAIDNNLPNIQGPANGVISLLAHCGATCEVGAEGIKITHTESGLTTNLMHGSDAVFRKSISDYASRHILASLANRVNGIEAGRKDMVGITSVVDRNATFSLRKPAAYARIKNDCKEYIEKQPDATEHAAILKRLWHKYLTTIIAGATRFGDRLLADKDMGVRRV